MNDIKLYNGDCLELMKDIPDGSVDLVLTDIPYGKVNRKSNGLRNLDKGKADIVTFDLKELTETLCDKTKGSIHMFCSTEQVSAIRDIDEQLENGEYDIRHTRSVIEDMNEKLDKYIHTYAKDGE